MRKIIVFSSGKTVGTDCATAVAIDDDMTEGQISDIVHGVACDDQSAWFDLVTEDEYDEDDDRQMLESEVDSWWEDYDPEKHDCLRSGGGSFESDF